MAHAISDRGMMFVGATPWHGLGRQVSSEDSYNIDRCIVAAGLDWDTLKVPLFTKEGREVPGAHATIRSDDGFIFGTVGDVYTVLQNRDAFRFFQPFLDTKQVSIETAGSLYDGAVVWILAKLAGNLEVTFGDQVDKYLCLSHSHDGSRKLNVFGTGVRVVCQNTLNLAMGSKETRFFGSMRHTKTMETRLDSVREDIARANHLFLLEVEKYRFLAGKDVTPAKQAEYFRKVLGLPESGDLPTKSANRLNRLVELAETSPGADLKSAKGTWWGALNGVTYFQSHEYGRSQDARLDSLWFGGDGVDALNLALEMASA